MALTRKALAAMGIEETQIDEIINIHTDVVNEIKDERDKYKSKASQLDAVKEELESLKEESKQGDRSPYKKKYEEVLAEKETLQTEFDSYKADVEAGKTKEKQRNAYRKLLAEAGVSEKRIDSVLKLAEVDGKFENIEFEGDSVKDSETLTNAIKEDYSDFIASTEVRGATTATPPANESGNPTGISRAAQLAARYHANLYGESKEV